MRLLATLILLCALAYDQFRVHAQCSKPTISGPGGFIYDTHAQIRDQLTQGAGIYECEKAFESTKYKNQGSRCAIRVNSKLYACLKCYSDHGWTGIDIADKEAASNCFLHDPIKATNDHLTEIQLGRNHLTVSIHKFRTYFTWEGGLRVYCQNTSHDMFYDGVHVGYNEAVCTNDGWTFATVEPGRYEPAPNTTDPMRPMRFDCKPGSVVCTYHNTTGILFDAGSRTITCPKSSLDETIFTKIGLNGRFYDSLNCVDDIDNFSHTWKSGEERVVEGFYPISVVCVELCAFEGAGITKTKKGNNVEVTCADPTLRLFVSSSDSMSLTNVNQHVANDKAQCGGEKGWSGSALLESSNKEKIKFECLKVCESTGPVIRTTIGNEIQVTCNDPDHYLFYADKPVKRSKAKCSADNGWSGSEFMKKDDLKTPIQFVCKKPPAELCKIGIEAGKYNFDANRTLTCVQKDTKLVAISVNSNRYLSMQCDPYFDWSAGETEIAEANKELPASCVEYCASEGVTVFKTHDRIETQPCSGQDLLFQGTNRVNKASCSFNSGWKIVGDSSLHISDTATPLRFECKNIVPCAVQEPDQSMTSPTRSGGKLTCNAGEKSLASIVLNSMHFTSLECNAVKWQHGNEFIASAYTPLPAKCAQECVTTGEGILARKEKKDGIDTIVVSCLGGDQSLASIVVNANHYAALECYSGNWRHKNEIITNAYAPLDVKCAPACVSSGKTIETEKVKKGDKIGVHTMEVDTIYVKCANWDSQKKMIVDSHKDIGNGGALCQLDKGWWTWFSEAFANSSKSLNLECRFPPSPYERDRHNSRKSPERSESGDDDSSGIWRANRQKQQQMQNPNGNRNANANNSVNPPSSARSRDSYQPISDQVDDEMSSENQK